MLRLPILTALTACLALVGCGPDTEEVTATASESASTTGTDDTGGATGGSTEPEGSTTLDGGSTTVDDSATTIDEGSTGAVELECGWRVTSIDVDLPSRDGTFPVAVATCSESGVRLTVLTAGSASCEAPSSTPGCDDAYRAVTLRFAPEQLEAGIYDISDVSHTVDLQGGGGAKVECNFISGGAESGEVIISSVTESGISGYVTAVVSKGPGSSVDVSGRFETPLCPAPES